MIVYGDARRTEPTRLLIAGLRHDLDALAAVPPGLERRASATRWLIDAGELTQGLLDDAFAARGLDDWDALARCCGELLLHGARLMLPAVGQDSRLARNNHWRDGDVIGGVLQTLADLPLPDHVTVHVPEGYAFYALYPELYAEAARLFSAAYPGPVLVLGLRSIGTSLAAVVAASTGAVLPPVTLRPAGHPFQREVRVSERLRQVVFTQPAPTRFAIVDEGPGLSGSSFGAVADWLEDGGIARERIHFFPGHGGDLGPRAQQRHRERWRQAPRHVADFDQLLLGGDQLSGASWFEDDISATALPLEDVAGGRWRAHHFAAASGWPPANTHQERRKYLYNAHGRTWLARFAGLGRYGEALWARGQVLDRAGLVPPLRGLRYGFLIQEWLAGARPLPACPDVDRAALVERVAEHLGLIAREFPAGERARGADPAQLLHMTRFNTEQRFGPELAALLDRWQEHLGTLVARVRRTLTDNRMHAWEWLVLPDGRVLKTDALEHHAAHDCIGAQDLTWDVVGAAVELGLDEGEQQELDRRLARTAPYRPDPLLKQFYRPCYLAFEMGYYTLAAQAHEAGQPEEASRLNAAAERYAGELRRVLCEGVPTPGVIPPNRLASSQQRG